MPWKEACAASKRHHLVKLVRERISASEATRTLGISRNTAYRRLWRHDRWDVEGLPGRRRARRRQEHETPPSARMPLVALRKVTGAGPREYPHQDVSETGSATEWMRQGIEVCRRCCPDAVRHGGRAVLAFSVRCIRS